MAMKEQFKLEPEAIKRLGRKILIRTELFGLLAAGIGVLIGMRNVSSDNIFPMLVIMIPLWSLLTLLGSYHGMKRQKALLNSYILTFDGEFIIREGKNVPTIRHAYQDITEIIKNPHGSYLIKAKSMRDAIIVFRGIGQPQKLEQLLCQIRPITNPQPKTLNKYLAWSLVPGAMLLIVAVVLSNNKIIVALCGPVLAVIMVYSLLETQRSKQVDKKTKRGAWLILLPLLSIIWITVIKLLN